MTISIPKKLPDYFYDPCHAKRWFDKYSSAQDPDAKGPHDDGEERLVLTPQEIVERNARNEAYAAWFKLHRLPTRRMNWQLIRVHDARWFGDYSSRDWWIPFQNAVFRVFVNPIAEYAKQKGAGYRQWYVLCPEDAELVCRYRIGLKNPEPRPRNILNGERFISKEPALRKCLMVPTECCKHYRHETFAGKLPGGL